MDLALSGLLDKLRLWFQRRRIPLGEEPCEETAAKEVGAELDGEAFAIGSGWINRPIAHTKPESSRATAVTATWDFFLPIRVR